MKDVLFNTKKKVNAAISGFTNLMAQPGWELLGQVIDQNIEELTKLILDGINLEGEKATQKETDRLRDKLKVYKEVKNTPEKMIKKLTSPEETEEPNPDPFHTAESLKKERERVSG